MMISQSRKKWWQRLQGQDRQTRWGCAVHLHILKLGTLTTTMSNDEYCQKRAPCDLLRKIIKYGCDIWRCQSQCEWHRVLTKANVMVGNNLFLRSNGHMVPGLSLLQSKSIALNENGDDLASLLQLGSRRCIYYNECDWFCYAKDCMAQRFNMPC